MAGLTNIGGMGGPWSLPPIGLMSKPMEDDLRWMEEDLQWKTTFDGRRPSIEDILRWKTTDGGRVIKGEVFLQKSFPYSGHMCRLLRRRSDYCHRVAIF